VTRVTPDEALLTTAAETAQKLALLVLTSHRVFDLLERRPLHQSLAGPERARGFSALRVHSAEARKAFKAFLEASARIDETHGDDKSLESDLINRRAEMALLLRRDQTVSATSSKAALQPRRLHKQGTCAALVQAIWIIISRAIKSRAAMQAGTSENDMSTDAPTSLLGASRI